MLGTSCKKKQKKRELRKLKLALEYQTSGIYLVEFFLTVHYGVVSLSLPERDKNHMQRKTS